MRSASRAAILSVSTRCSTARFSSLRSRSANEVERPRTVLRALVFVIVFRTSTVYRAWWLCEAIEARPSASRSRPGCADAVLPGRRLWWLCRPSRATQPLPVVPTPDGAGTTFKMLQVRLLISPCSVLRLGTRFAYPKTTEAVRSPSVQISRSLRSHALIRIRKGSNSLSRHTTGTFSP